MSRVITFSRHFPSYHPKKGEGTFFVEKMFASFLSLGIEYHYASLPLQFLVTLGSVKVDPKHHTIREGDRWKVGDKFSPRIWTGKPYNSKQLILAPDVEIKKIIPIEILGMTVWVGDKVVNSLTLADIARNDGLDITDFKNWFKKLPFKGQIICWNENIDYVEK